jgi:ribose-phosphate pyrophosphokinase
VHKTRDPLKPNQVVAHKVVGDVEGRTCLLIDDMIDTAGTICSAAEMLKESGVEDIVIASTHAIMSGPAVERLAKAPVSEVIVTNTLPLPKEAQDLEKITTLSIAPLVAKAIWEVFNDGSVTTLFGGLS